MRLLFVTGSLVHGGAERHTITLANRLAERGHECHLAYVKDDSSQLARLRGVEAGCLHAARYLDWDALAKLGDLIARICPTHLIAVNQYALLYAWLAKRRSATRAPLAVTFHSTKLLNAKEWLKMLYLRPLFWSADWLGFVCRAQLEYWRRRRLSARRTEVIYNGVDLEHWRPRPMEESSTMRRVMGIGHKDLVIGMSAVLRPEKNHLQLIDALARLRRGGVAARALLIGDGPMRGAIEARARSAGVADEVTITGLQQDVRPLVAACDALALCSTTEAFSLAALEAMALARPVVHADIGGAAEMIRPGQDGYLFPVGDTRALVERLGALQDRVLRAHLGEQARASVVERFSERAMVEHYEQTLLELASARSQRDPLRRNAAAH